MFRHPVAISKWHHRFFFLLLSLHFDIEVDQNENKNWKCLFLNVFDTKEHSVHSTVPTAPLKSEPKG